MFCWRQNNIKLLNQKSFAWAQTYVKHKDKRNHKHDEPLGVRPFKQETKGWNYDIALTWHENVNFHIFSQK